MGKRAQIPTQKAVEAQQNMKQMHIIKKRKGNQGTWGHKETREEFLKT